MEKTSSNKKKTSKLRSEESTKAHLGKKLRDKKANNKLTDKEVAKAKKLKNKVLTQPGIWLQRLPRLLKWLEMRAVVEQKKNMNQ